MISFKVFTLHLIFPLDKINENKMGGICSTYKRNEKWVQNFSSKNLKEKSHLGETGVYLKIILIAT
jgi:hypothetical protein